MILESLSFTNTLYAFDFDGTLSKIVRKPADATVTDATDRLLKKLSSLVPVCVISGRSIADLKQRLKYRPKYLVGNHGLEGLGRDNSEEILGRARIVCDGWKAKIAEINLGPGIELEDKSFSLAIHFRRSRNKKLAREKIREIISELDPQPQTLPGKSVVNILPAGAPHKGVAMMELMKITGAKRAFYIGDDDTDEDVFGLPDSGIFTVRVGFKKASLAQFYIDRQSSINSVLKTLINFHEKAGAK